jgi:hypothetical protein
MEEDQKTWLEMDYNLASAIDKQMTINLLSKKALEVIEKNIEELTVLLSHVRLYEIKKHNETEENSNNYLISKGVVKDAFSRAEMLYKIILGLKDLYGKPYKDKSKPRCEGSGLFSPLELLVKIAERPAPYDVGKAAKDKPRKDFNKLRIENNVYDAVFHKFVSPVSNIYYSAHNMYGSRETDSNLEIDANTFNDFATLVHELEHRVNGSRVLLPKEETHRKGIIPLTTMILSVARITELHYEHIQLKNFKKPLIQLHVDEIPEDVIIMGNDFEIMQALLTILMDKTHVLSGTPDPKVRIGFSGQKGFVKIDISDNGPSIPYEKEDLIFENAAKEMPTKRKVCDISVARSYIERNRGEIHAKNSEGVSFDITLPAS